MFAISNPVSIDRSYHDARRQIEIGIDGRRGSAPQNTVYRNGVVLANVTLLPDNPRPLKNHAS
jgi:hypothetical protein